MSIWQWCWKSVQGRIFGICKNEKLSKMIVSAMERSIILLRYVYTGKSKIAGGILAGKSKVNETLDTEICLLFNSTKKYYTIEIPGHRQYVSKALSKKIWANIVILVVFEEENQFNSSFHKGQVKEHVLLYKRSGVDNNIAAVNKIGLVRWSKQSFDSIKKYVKTF